MAVNPGLSRAGLPVEFEDVDMRATLAEEIALAKSKIAPPRSTRDANICSFDYKSRRTSKSLSSSENFPMDQKYSFDAIVGHVSDKIYFSSASFGCRWLGSLAIEMGIWVNGSVWSVSVGFYVERHVHDPRHED